MPWHRSLLGYHGCDASLARSLVLRESHLRPSRNEYDWLGNGAYFWEDDPKRAFEWASTLAQQPNSSIEEPAVVGAVLELGNCLNLSEQASLDLLLEAYEDFQQVVKRYGLQLPKNTGEGYKAHYLDCAVFEFLHKKRKQQDEPPFDTVRAFFIEGTELYPTAGVRTLDHVQLCVRNPAVIRGFFLPALEPRVP